MWIWIGRARPRRLLREPRVRPTLTIVATLALACALIAPPGFAAEGDGQSTAPTTMLGAAERAWLSRHRDLRVGVAENRPPYEYLDADGRYSGVSSAFAGEAARRLGLMLHPKAMQPGAQLDAILRHEIDLIPWITPDDAYADHLKFTEPYLISPAVILTRRDARYIGGLEDMSGMRVGVISSDLLQERLRREHPQIAVTPMRDAQKLIDALEEQKLDAAVVALGSAVYWTRTRGNDRLRIAAPTPFKVSASMGVRRDWPELVDILNRTLAAIPKERRRELEEAWISFHYEVGLDARLVAFWSAAIGIGLLGIIALVYAANRRLNEEIRQRRSTERALAEANERSRLILQSVGDGIFGLDSNGRTTFVNSAAERMIGYTELELAGRSMHESVHHSRPDGSPYPDDKCPMTATARDGVARRVTGEVFWRKDGTSFPIEYSAQPVRKDGRLVGTVVAFRDVTERRATEERLRARERQFRRLIESAPDAMVICNTRGEITMVNRQAEKILGYRRRELLNRPVEVLLPLRHRGEHPEFRARYIHDPQIRPMGSGRELIALHKDGYELPVEISLAPIETDEGVLIASSIRDISERKRAEKAIRESDVLKDKVREIERFNHLAVERERRILELKRQVNLLARKTGQSEPYRSASETSAPQPHPMAKDAEPRESVGDIDLADLLHIDQLQELLDNFCSALGVSAAIIDLDEQVLASARWQSRSRPGIDSGFSELMSEPQEVDCIEADIDVTREIANGAEFKVFRCINGLAGAAAPIVVEGRHLANVCIGQFLLHHPDAAFLSRTAEELDLTPEQFSAVASTAPVIPERRVPSILDFLAGFGRMLTSLSMERRRAAMAEDAAKRGLEELRNGHAAAMSLAEDAEQARAEKVRYQEHLEELVAERTEELRHNREQLQAILDHSPALIYAKDLDGQYFLVNRKWAELFGFSTDLVIGKTDRELFSEENADLSAIHDQRVLEAGEPLQMEESAEQEDGSHTYISHKFPLRDSTGRIYALCGISQDITALKKVEEELTHALDLAEEANRAKSDFLANTSHEIRTPMNAVIGMTHLALQTDLDARQRNFIEKANRSAKSLLGIINDILDLNKIEAGKLVMETIDFRLEEVMDNLTSLLGPSAAQKGLELLLDIAPSMPRALVGDPLRLGQILTNLGNNAVKFTERGEIVISARPLEIGEEAVVVQFSVRDSGIGMSDAQMAKLFNPFTQGDSSIVRKFGGTGLGLAISKRLTEMMDGQIWAESWEGHGSMFHFTARLGVQSQAQRERQTSRDLAGTRVLIADDNTSARSILAAISASIGFRTETAPDGSSALKTIAKAESDGDPFPVVLLDWQMPHMNGLETIEAMRGSELIKTEPAVVMVTAHSSEELGAATNEIGCAAVLTKPVSASTLLDTVAGILIGADRSVRGKAEHHLAEEQAAASQLRGARLLLVEDNMINQELAMELLTGAGLSVAVANNGQEALDLLARERFDGVLMDVQMPVMDGYTATREIRAREQLAELPVIAMTANAMAGDREIALEHGMNDHIAKPVNVREMFVTLARWVTPSNPPPAAAPEPPSPAETPRALDLPHIEGLDSQTGLTNAGGKPELYLRLLGKFRDDFRDFVDTHRSLRQSGEDEATTRHAHSLKGVAGTLGATNVQERAKALEFACRDQLAIKEQERCLFRVAQVLAPLIESLDRVQLTPAARPARQQINPAMIAAMEPLLERLQHLLEDSDAAALEDAAALAQQIQTPKAARLLEHVESFDFTGALEALGNLREDLDALGPSEGEPAAQLISKLRALLENDDADALTLIEPLKRHGELTEQESKLDELAQQIDDFAFDEALATLNDIEAALTEATP